MKWLAIILSAIILSLNAIPCSDNEDMHEQTSVEHKTHNHDTEEHSDHCSPFCVCDCCSTQMVVQLDFNFYRNQITEIFPITEKPYSDLYSNLFHQQILQPPRLA